MAQRSYGAIASDGYVEPRQRSMSFRLAAGGLMVAALGLVAVALVGHAPAEHEVDLMGTWTKPSGIGIDKVQTIISLCSFLFPCTCRGTFFVLQIPTQRLRPLHTEP